MARVTPKASAKLAKAEMYRKLIVEAAEPVFAERGYDEAKMQDIALAAGIALGTLYTVFPGKAELYGAIQEQRGREMIEGIYRAIQGYDGVLDACTRGIDAYVRVLVERPAFLRMHLRDGLSWTDPSARRSGEELVTLERGMSLAVSLLEVGIERGFLHGDSRPEVVLKMMVAAHQVQLQDWLDRGAAKADVGPLIERMQQHFVRAFVVEARGSAARERTVVGALEPAKQGKTARG
jgi:AcrR family transcriptional regulator